MTTVGSSAASWIEAGGRGTVIAVFDRSIYLEDSRQDLICVGGNHLGRGPLNALVESAILDTSGINVGFQLELDCRHAALWRPRVLPVYGTLDLCRGLDLLERVLSAKLRPQALAQLQEGLNALEFWIDRTLKGEDDPLPTAVLRLIGLGPGLTPSGDDALAGALIALRQLASKNVADLFAGFVLPLARAHTNKISYSHLAAAAKGEWAEALHIVLEPMVRGDAEAIGSAILRLDQVGHSSGWDALSGLIAAVKPLSKRTGIH